MDPNAPRTNSPASEPAVSDAKRAGARASMQQRMEDKPMLIYVTLLVGALALLLLLMIVWLSTRNDASKVKLCLDTTAAQAQSAILEGNVRRIDVLLDQDSPVQGLTAIQLELDGGECRKLPEGADNRDKLLQVLGLAELYNQQGDGNIRVEYQRETIPPNLLVTSTPIPTMTPPTREASPVTGTPLPVIVSSPTPAPTETAIPTATAAPTDTAVPTNTAVPTDTPTVPATTIPPTAPALLTATP